MTGVAAAILRVDRVTTGVAAALAALCMVVAVAAGFWQVATRFLLASPSAWSEPLVRMALIWMVMLGLGPVLREGALVSIDIAERVARGRLRTVIRLAIVMSNLLMLGLLAWFGVSMALRVVGQTLSGLEVSITWGYAAIPLGALVGIIGTIAHFFDRRSAELEAAT